MSRTKGSTNRSSAYLDKEAHAVVSYVKRAPKTGRRYADMARFTFQRQFGKRLCLDFDTILDRNILTSLMTRITAANVARVGTRYMFIGK